MPTASTPSCSVCPTRPIAVSALLRRPIGPLTASACSPLEAPCRPIVIITRWCHCCCCDSTPSDVPTQNSYKLSSRVFPETDEHFIPAQASNMYDNPFNYSYLDDVRFWIDEYLRVRYVFPGIGLAASTGNLATIPNQLFYIAASEWKTSHDSPSNELWVFFSSLLLRSDNWFQHEELDLRTVL